MKNKYEMQLEDVLDKKNFDDEAKSLILNILYKIENSYKDYQLVKQNVKSRNEITQDIINIINYRCNSIEILNPQETKAKLYVDKNNKIIKTFPNEIDLLQAIYYMKTPYTKNMYDISEKSVHDTLEKGLALDGVEIIRDFNGWSWNNSIESERNQIYNLIYQTITILIGQDKLELIIENNNIIQKLEYELKIMYGEKRAQSIIDNLTKVCIMMYIGGNKKRCKELETFIEDRQKKYNEIFDKSNYINNMTIENIEDIRNLERVEQILSNERLLQKKFSTKSISEKYGEINIYKEYLQKYKEMAQNRVNERKKMMNPFEYVKNKEQIQKELKFYNGIKNIVMNKKNLIKELMELQKKLIECYYRKIAIYDLKKELISLVYEIRYYNNIRIGDTKICSIKELREGLEGLKRALLNKMSISKFVNNISTNYDIDYEIKKYIFDSDIINFNKMYIKLDQKDELIIVQYFDEQNIEYEKEIVIDKEEHNNINKKMGKKVKFFV